MTERSYACSTAGRKTRERIKRAVKKQRRKKESFFRRVLKEG